MIKFYVLVLLAMLGGPILAQDSIVDGPVIEFDNVECDYGTVELNSDPNREFVFANTGNQPLIIATVRSSCGCMIGTWPHDPIEPGESAVIKVKSDPKRIGMFKKSLAVESNAVNTPNVRLYIKGRVLPRPEEN
jgi:hypothetical protein